MTRKASRTQRYAALEVIKTEVAGCTRCAELVQSRSQTVFGVGDPGARLCFLGEAPGADEDRLGEPFVGRAGQLLTKMIEACSLRREDVYIMNVLKCRPPSNRTPQTDEISDCRGYFERQIEVLQPEFICCLGAVAAKALLETKQPLGRLRGRIHDCQGIQVLVTYHPAYLLRYPQAKRDAWSDLKMLMRAMGI
jgi:DNA polymerase